jgi:Mce-associated membrane protein
MSNSNPSKPVRRRRIAGERKPVRDAIGHPASEEPAPPAPAAHPPKGGTEVEPPVREEAAPPPARAGTDAEESSDGRAPGRLAGLLPAGRDVPLRVVAGLGALALLLVAAATWYGVPMLREVREAHGVDDAQQMAPAAAERAATAILSYDYRSLDTDKKSAVRFMTDKYGKKYVDTFDHLVKGNAEQVKAKVDAQVVSSGVSMAQPDRANVLLYVDQTTTSTANSGQPQTALNRVMFSMVDRDGTWLVDHIASY